MSNHDVKIPFLFNLLIIVLWFETDKSFKRVTPEGTFNYIRMDWQTASYNETTDWCHSLGGSLPVLHTQDDLDLFTERVIRKTSSNMVGNYSCSFQGMSMERQDIHREFAFLDHRLLIHVL